MRYCKTCVLPDTRPNVFLNEEGVCCACLGQQEKDRTIDWEARRRELGRILDTFRDPSGISYDCIIPVSGGKDSTYQAYMMKQVYGMRPLAVTYRYSDRTPIGQRNLDNLRRLGVDHVDVAPNPETERKFVKKALIKAGDPCLPDHMGMFAVTLRMAVNFRIPLIIWGENPELEYGGSATDRDNPYLDRAWLKKHGCLQGTMAEDWVDEELTLGDMALYRVPSDEELKAARLSSIFLGYYLRWDSHENYAVAARLGFEKHPDGPKMGLYDFADVDSTNIVVHHYIKWLKFGMTRLHDHIAIDIRSGRMTREEGVRILKSREERYPAEEIQKLCDFVGMTEREFWAALDRFRNPAIWSRDANGQWTISGHLEGLE